MHEDEFEFKREEEFSEHNQGDLSFEEARQDALDNDEIDAEEAGFTAGFNAETEPEETEQEQ